MWWKFWFGGWRYESPENFLFFNTLNDIVQFLAAQNVTSHRFIILVPDSTIVVQFSSYFCRSLSSRHGCYLKESKRPFFICIAQDRKVKIRGEFWESMWLAFVSQGARHYWKFEHCHCATRTTTATLMLKTLWAGKSSEVWWEELVWSRNRNVVRWKHWRLY
jgi:hypothetical protein